MSNFEENNNHEEYQYIDLIKRIINEGTIEKGRNGNTLSVFGNMMRFSLKNNIIPLLTTKKLAWKTCFRELMWFIQGKTDNYSLNDKGVHIWDDNSSREFLDSRGLIHYPEGVLGPIYGFQWRHFNASYTGASTDYKNQGIDQLQNIINDLKDSEKRTSRRLIMTAWNPCQLDEMALPPCHILCQFNVTEGKYLSCALYQRSGDVGLGVPFNIASYSFLTHIIAKHCSLQAKEFVYFLGNAHIYEEHIDALKEQITRIPYEFPRADIKVIKENIEDYSESDLEWIDEYKYHPIIKMKMKA
jgi:thymidylate synthase